MSGVQNNLGQVDEILSPCCDEEIRVSAIGDKLKCPLCKTDKYEVKKDSLNIYEDDNRLGKPTAVSETSIDESALSNDWTKFATEDSE